MHACHMLCWDLGSREGNKLRFSFIVTGLYEMLHPNFRKFLFHALLG